MVLLYHQMQVNVRPNHEVELPLFFLYPTKNGENNCPFYFFMKVPNYSDLFLKNIFWPQVEN